MFTRIKSEDAVKNLYERKVLRNERITNNLVMGKSKLEKGFIWGFMGVWGFMYSMSSSGFMGSSNWFMTMRVMGVY